MKKNNRILYKNYFISIVSEIFAISNLFMANDIGEDFKFTLSNSQNIDGATLDYYASLVNNMLRLYTQIGCAFINNVRPVPIRWMAGHSKWANIKHVKAQKDGMKAALFTRLARQIRLAIQDGGSSDPVLNSTLRSVMDLAIKKNMPMASIQNTIKKSQQSKTQIKKYRMDIRFNKNVYLICTIYSDNFAGVKMDAATIVKKAGAAFVDVSHMFEDFGLVESKYDISKLSQGQSLEERVTEDAIECGAEEVDIIDESNGFVSFICNPTHLIGVTKALDKSGYIIENSEHLYTPNVLVSLNPQEQKSYNTFVQKLRDLAGLEDIYDNVEIK